jgi:arabinofuranan 3-O-arabinosyltransferase
MCHTDSFGTMSDVQLGPVPPTRLRDTPRRGLTAALWVVAVVACAQLVVRSYVQDRYLVDFRALHDGAVRFWDGVSVYADPWFLLTPSGLLAMLPFGLVGPDAAFVLWNTASIGAAAIGIACSMRLFGVKPSGPVAGAIVLLVCLSESLTSTLLLGNLNNSLLLALGAGFLLAERRRRWVLAGILLGLSLALKPVLVLLLLLPLLRRGWSTLGWALSVPLVLNVLGLALVPVRSDFLAVTVPNLLGGRESYNSSLWAVGTYFGVPGWAILGARLLVLVLAGVAVWRLRLLQDTALRLATSYGVLLLATCLASSLSQGYYSLFLLPLLAAAVRAGSAMRTPVAWVSVWLFAAQDSWALLGHPESSEAFRVYRYPLGWAVLLVVLVAWTLRRVPPERWDLQDVPGVADDVPVRPAQAAGV